MTKGNWSPNENSMVNKDSIKMKVMPNPVMPSKETKMTYKNFLIKAETSETLEEISISWTIGGLSGGSCYGGADHAITAEDEPEFKKLDEILENVCPKITYIQYKNLCSNLIKTKEKTEYEYYGNYYEVRTKTINLKELYDYLKKKNII